MNKKTIKNNINKMIFSIKKNSPEVLIVAGVIGTVSGAVLACYKTTKINDIFDKHKSKIDEIHREKSEGIVDDQKTVNKALTKAYISTGFDVVKLYAPAFVLEAVSLTAIISSNNILKQRNIALSAAYAILDKGFSDYRERVVDRFGDEIDKQLRFNINEEEIEEKKVNKNGKEITKKTTITKFDPTTISDYARIFDETNPNWEKNSEFNLNFLKVQEAFANDKLKACGRLFLNDVYDMLGFEKTKAGQIIGWVYDEEHPIGDNFVDFGIYNMDNPRTRAFVNGYERNILLDFNVDGNIWDLM